MVLSSQMKLLNESEKKALRYQNKLVGFQLPTATPSMAEQGCAFRVRTCMLRMRKKWHVYELN